MSLFSDSYNKTIEVKKIQPNNFNPNSMPKKTFGKLKASLKEFGQLNPIIVREITKNKFEIVDGEWRWRASKELGISKIECKVIKASKEEVIKLIFATTIKGKHDVYTASDMIAKLAENSTPDQLKAANLDLSRIRRRTKYNKVKGAERKDKLKDEKDGVTVKPIEKYKKVLLFTVDSDKYDEVLKRLRKIDGNLSDALIKLLDIK